MEKIEIIFDGLSQSSSEAERACGSVVHEILVTEQRYVSDLRLIIDRFMLPLRGSICHIRCKEFKNSSAICEHRMARSVCNKTSRVSRPILDSEAIDSIFMNVETLVKVNLEILEAIQAGLQALITSQSSPPSVIHIVQVFVSVFISILPFFQVYSFYCHRFQVAIDKLVVARTKSKVFDEFLKVREQQSGNSLHSLLIKPVQRICKYKLFFESLLKNILEYVSEEYQRGADFRSLDEILTDVEKALAMADEVAKGVNEKVGELEGLEQMMMIYAELGGEESVPNLVTPHRRYIDKVEVSVQRSPSDDKSKSNQEFLYIFNDQLVFASRAHHSFERKSSLKSSVKEFKDFDSWTQRFSIKNLVEAFKSLGTFVKPRKGLMSMRKLSDLFWPKEMAVVSQVDLRNAHIKIIEKPDEAGQFGLVLTFSTRVLRDDVGKGKATSENKIKTTIDKCVLWLPTNGARDHLHKIIKEQLERLANQEIQFNRAKRSFGGSLGKKNRDWRNRSRTKEIKRTYHAIRKASQVGGARPITPLAV